MVNKTNHQGDIKNPNERTNGTNTTYHKNLGNRGKQLNTNPKGRLAVHLIISNQLKCTF
jgi:hypothetical protein